MNEFWRDHLDTQPQTWRLPDPPASHVVSVFDCERNEWHRVAQDGVHWRDEYGIVSWDELVVKYGPIREGARAR